MIQTKSKGNVLYQKVPTEIWIDNLKYDQEGKPILNRHNKIFRRITNIEDKTSYKQGEPIKYSNIPRALSYNSLLLEQGANSRVLSPYEFIFILSENPHTIPELKDTYADTNAVSIFPNAGISKDNEELRKQVVEGIFGKELSDIKIPYIAMNLKPIPADNEYGFTFTGTDFKELQEAPYLTKNQKVICKDGTLVPSPDQTKGIKVWTPTEQSGLRRLYRLRDDVLDARNDYLLDSSVSGRVQLIRDPKGLAKNLETLLI